ncbi:vinculin-like [Diadema setosum]|uniref:vinculin-like n=1 Tax=Diadema setosum TaxID=31175 RepID=UPI003B3A784B
MPVFHTKTIEAILEPVAQQVSQLVILHEEAQDGNAMPDLSRPVMAVSAAVQNLVKVGKDTAESTQDKILKQEMPPAFQKVEESAHQLSQAAMTLKTDPFSSEARKILIDGARGILGGTSDLLLCFDQSEVRKILAVAKGVMEYLAVSEVVDIMQDLVTFVKNLTPGMTNLAQKVTARSKELTHVAHANGLINHTESLKRTTPILISSMKIYVTTLQKGGRGREEAQQNRTFIVGRMSHEITEIMRILKLTSADEDDWSMDDIQIMKKAAFNINNQLQSAKTWLSNPEGEPGGLGEKAVRDILKDARRVADRTEGAERERLLATINEVETMMDQLCALRAKGQGNSPEALQLAHQIAVKLDYLQKQVDDSVKRAMVSGVTKTAYTLAGKVEQAQKWLRNPTPNDMDVANRAIAGIVSQGRKVAENMTGPERAELLQRCAEVEQLAKQITDLVKRGMGNSPEADRVARLLAEKLPALQKMIENALVKEVVDAFMDTTTPIKQLEKAAKAPIDVPDREPTYTSKATIFLRHANTITDTAKAVAAAGNSNDRQLVEELNGRAQEVRDLAPQVVAAGKVLLLNPGEQMADSHFAELKKEYMGKVEGLTDLVDQATDTVQFVKASEEAIKRDSEAVSAGIQQQNPNIIIEKASNIARRAKRVADVASKEAANSEDPEFVAKVTAAAEQLSNDISPTVTAAKSLAMNPGHKPCEADWMAANTKLVKSVAAVRLPLTVEIPSEQDFPPPPPLPPLGAMEHSTVPQVRALYHDPLQVSSDFTTESAAPLPPPPPPSSAYSKQATPPTQTQSSHHLQPSHSQASSPHHPDLSPFTPPDPQPSSLPVDTPIPACNPALFVSTSSLNLTPSPHADPATTSSSPGDPSMTSFDPNVAIETGSENEPRGTSRNLQVGPGSSPKRMPSSGSHQPASRGQGPSFDLPEELQDDLEAVLRTFPNYPSPPSIETPTYAPPPPRAAPPSTAPRPRKIQSDVVDVRKALVVNQEPILPPPPDLSQLQLEETEAAPPRPPLPGDVPPPRPPPPEDTSLPVPVQGSQQPIMQAAYDLHVETAQWSSKDNDLIAAAKRMAQLMAAMSKHVSGEGGNKKDLIDTAKEIVKVAALVTRLTREIANQCTDIRMRVNLLQVCERIPTISTQLKILSTVKAVMLGAQETEEDQEATEMLVGNAQNLMRAVKETVRAAKAASIKIRTDAGYKMRWERQRPWYQY